MSSVAYMLHCAPMGFTNPAPLHIKARYAFIELVRPDCWKLYSIEQYFGIFRWMVQTACATTPTESETGRWGASGPVDLLNGSPSCVNAPEVDGIRGIQDLSKRCHYALLARDIGSSAHRWRNENRININESRILTFPHYAPFCGAPLLGKPTSESDIGKALTGLLESSAPLTTQLNSSYSQATENYGVRVCVRPGGFVFRLEYGFDGSVWHHILAETPHMWEGEGDTFRRIPYTRRSEPFLDTMSRAIAALAELTK